MPPSHHHPIPQTWPGPDPTKSPAALINRVTADQLSDLYNRRITTRQLAKDLGVAEKWLSYLYHGRAPSPRKSDLRAARLGLRMMYAQQVIDGKISVSNAAKLLYCSYNTVRRAVIKLQEASNHAT